MTRCQPVPSAKAPWTRTIVGFVFAALGGGGAPLPPLEGGVDDWARRAPPVTVARASAARKSRPIRVVLVMTPFFQSAEPESRPAQRKVLKAARRSPTSRSGCSHAAK